MFDYIHDRCRHLYVAGAQLLERYSLAILFVVGLMLLIGGLAKLAHADGIGDAVSGLADGKEISAALAGIVSAATGGAEQNINAGTLASPEAVDYRQIQCSTSFIFQILNGSFGAFLLIGATISTLIAAWIQFYRVAFGMIIFIAGTLIVQPMTEMMFGTDYSTVPDQLPIDARCD